MLILNFSYSSTGAYQVQSVAVARHTMNKVRVLPTQIHRVEPLRPQICSRYTDVQQFFSEGLLLINLSSQALRAYQPFSLAIHLRPEGALPGSDEVAELLNMQAMRESARTGR
jgi:hypothetical protein